MANLEEGVAERLIRRRRRLLILVTVAFVILQVGYLTGSARLVEAIPNGNARTVDILSVIGSIAWSLLLVRLLATGGRLARNASDDVRAILDDELTLANRRAAFQAGYITLLLGTCAFYVFFLFRASDAVAAMPALIAFGAIVPVMWFLVLDRRGKASG